MSCVNDKDILKELTDLEVVELKELYFKKYGPDNYHYMLLYNQCKWNDELKKKLFADSFKTPDESDKWIAFRKKFYTHREYGFRKSGTYISLHFDLIQSISFNTWHDEYELYECLEKTQFINWQNGPLMTNVDEKFCKKVKSIAASKEVQVEKARTCSFMLMQREIALNLKIPSLDKEYVLTPLRKEDMRFIHDLWSNKNEGSLEYLIGLLTLNKHLGIYRAIDNELLAWVFQNDFSGIGMLETSPLVQRRGFASILTACISKQIAEEENISVSGWIKRENFKSSALLSKLGYQFINDVEWIQFINNTKPIQK